MKKLFITALIVLSSLGSINQVMAMDLAQVMGRSAEKADERTQEEMRNLARSVCGNCQRKALAEQTHTECVAFTLYLMDMHLRYAEGNLANHKTAILPFIKEAMSRAAACSNLDLIGQIADWLSIQVKFKRFEPSEAASVCDDAISSTSSNDVLGTLRTASERVKKGITRSDEELYLTKVARALGNRVTKAACVVGCGARDSVYAFGRGARDCSYAFGRGTRCVCATALRYRAIPEVLALLALEACENSQSPAFSTNVCYDGRSFEAVYAQEVLLGEVALFVDMAQQAIRK